MKALKVIALCAAIAPVAAGSSVQASAWNYGCKGTLPVFDGNTALLFNRELLALLPVKWLAGSLHDFIARDPTDETVALAKAQDENSGLAQTMVFTLLDHPDKKLTLTEKSSKTISDSREKMAAPRFVQLTSYKKMYGYVSDFGIMGPFDITLDCMEYQVSAPLR